MRSVWNRLRGNLWSGEILGTESSLLSSVHHASFPSHSAFLSSYFPSILLPPNSVSTETESRGRLASELWCRDPNPAYYPGRLQAAVVCAAQQRVSELNIEARAETTSCGFLERTSFLDLCFHGEGFRNSCHQGGLFARALHSCSRRDEERSVRAQKRYISSGSSALPGEGIQGASTSEDLVKSDQTLEKLVVYKGRWMRPFRLLVRFKVFQLTGIAALALPVAQYTQGTLALGTAAAIGAVVAGAGAASVALWYYSSRYIGELALLPPDHRRLRISTLDFWGNRQDIDVNVRDVVGPLVGLTQDELTAVANHVFLPLDVTGERQFVLSVKHGHIVNKDALFKLLQSKYE